MMKNMTGIYIINDNKILMLKRSKAESLNEWYSVGGRMEKEELNNPLACVLRELEEESGIKESDLQNIKLRYIAFKTQKDYISQNYIFFAELKNKSVVLKECDEGILEWVEIKDIFLKKLPATSSACLKHYFENDRKGDAVNIAVSTNENGVGKYIFTELSEFYN